MEEDENVTRILIIGKAGTGKSTVGNAILDKEMFRVVYGMQAGTLEVSVKREGGVEVIDTPDTEEGSIDNTHFKEIISPCLHAVLLTIRWNDCTQKDRALYLHTLAVLGNQFPSNSLMVVFTFSDSMEEKKQSSLMQTEEENVPASQSAIDRKRKMAEMEKSSLEQVKKTIPELRSIIDDKRYVFFKTQGTNQQRKDILEMVAKLGTAPPNIEIKDIANVPAREIRVLIIGKSRTGKSTVGNILLGERRFYVRPDTDAKMTTSFTESAVLQNYRITVTDTRDLINADFSRQDIKDEILTWKSDTMTKPHAILLTVRCDKPYSAAEYDMYSHLKKVWGDKDFCARLFLAFTFAGPSTDSINKLLDESSQLSSVFREAVGRNITFDNPAIQEKSEQRDTLIVIMEALETLKEIRLIAIGKTGAGKSSAGNTIMGEEKFKPVRGWGSGTVTCDWKEMRRNGMLIQMTDTPGVCDTHRTQDDIHREISKCIGTVTPGPHAVLMVIKAGDRFTKEEQDAYEELKRLFGEELTKYMIVVFTGMDFLEKDNIKLDDAMQKAPEKVREIVKEASGRYIGFNNEGPWDARRKQGDKLLAIVDQLIAENRGYYSNDLMKKFDQEVKKEAKGGATVEEVKKGIAQGKNETFFAKVAGFFVAK